jgi:hypothetical protein
VTGQQDQPWQDSPQDIEDRVDILNKKANLSAFFWNPEIWGELNP